MIMRQLKIKNDEDAESPEKQFEVQMKNLQV